MSNVIHSLLVGCLLSLSMNSQAAPSTQQISNGMCSPNVANVAGSVILQLHCEGIDAATLNEINNRLKKLEVNSKNIKLAYAETSKRTADLLTDPNDLHQGAGSLLITVNDNFDGDPAYGSLVSLSAMLTSSALFSNLDSVVLSREAKSVLHQFSIKLIALKRPILLSVIAHASPFCLRSNSRGRCSELSASSAKYSERLSLRKAEAVKRFLVEQGVPATCIDVAGKGNSAPLVLLPPDLDRASAGEINRSAILNNRVFIEMEKVDKNERGCAWT